MPSLAARVGLKSMIIRLSTSLRRKLEHIRVLASSRICRPKKANTSSISTKMSSTLTASSRRASLPTCPLPTEEVATEPSELLAPQMAIWTFNLMPRIDWIRHSRPRLEAYLSSSRIRTACLMQAQEILRWVKPVLSNSTSATTIPRVKAHPCSSKGIQDGWRPMMTLMMSLQRYHRITIGTFMNRGILPLKTWAWLEKQRKFSMMITRYLQILNGNLILRYKNWLPSKARIQK